MDDSRATVSSVHSGNTTEADDQAEICVFQCLKCRQIIGDSYNWVHTTDELSLIVLRSKLSDNERGCIHLSSVFNCLTSTSTSCSTFQGWLAHENDRTGGNEQVEDKTKFWAGTYYWTGPKFWAAGSKFWSAKSRVRLAGVTENAGRTCRKLSGIKRFFASRE